MPHTEISQSQWENFCDQFTKQHYSWIINLSVSDSKIDPSHESQVEDVEKQMQPVYHSVLFRSINADIHDDHSTILILVDREAGQAVHCIENPAHLFFRETAEGAHEGLVIENQAGQTTLLRFRAIALPEVLDGISEAELAVPGYGTT